MPSFILDIPDDYSNNFFGPFNSVIEAQEFFTKHYPKPIESLKLKESRANPRNLLTVYFTNVITNKYYKEGKQSFGNKFFERNVATLHEVNTNPCTMIIRDGH